MSSINNIIGTGNLSAQLEYGWLDYHVKVVHMGNSDGVAVRSVEHWAEKAHQMVEIIID